MTDAPERIMLQRTCGGGWSNFTTDYGTEYVRADLYEDLRARLATARADALHQAAEICDEECHNLNALTCNPPKSAAAWGQGAAF